MSFSQPSFPIKKENDRIYLEKIDKNIEEGRVFRNYSQTRIWLRIPNP